MRVRNATFIVLLVLLAAATVVAVLMFGRSPEVLPPRGAPSPTASPPADTATGNPPGQEQGPSSEKAEPPAPPAVIEPLITEPLPATGHRDGAIVDGFPLVISLAPRSEVMFSSVASEGDRVQVGLSALSRNAPGEVLDHYRSLFTGLGLVAESISTADGSSAVAFERGPSTVTVTVWSTHDGTRYTVFSVLVAGI